MILGWQKRKKGINERKFYQRSVFEESAENPWAGTHKFYATEQVWCREHLI